MNLLTFRQTRGRREHEMQITQTQRAKMFRRLALCFGITSTVYLAEECATANVIGTDLQNFNTTTNGIDYITVESSETLDQGLINAGFSINHAINSLPVFDDDSVTQSRFKANDSLMTTEINLGIGLMPNFEIGVSIPKIIRQQVDARDVAHGSFDTIGITSTRVNAKWRLWHNDRYGIAFTTLINYNRIGNNPYLGENQGPIYNTLLVLDTHLFGISVAGNIGYRWRKKSAPIAGTPIAPTKNQLITSAAVSYLISAIDTKLVAEVFGSRPVESSDSKFIKRQSSSAEATVGLKYNITSQLSINSGAGTELIHGASSPDWRLFAGVNWTVGPKFGPRADPFMGNSKPPAPKETIVLHSIEFKFGSDNKVLTGSLDIITKLVDRIKQPPPYKKIVIQGHTDSVGSESFNLNLSQRRANTIKALLIQKFHLNEKLVTAEGFGESKPIADNGNFQGRQKNRRVEIIIYR